MSPLLHQLLPSSPRRLLRIPRNHGKAQAQTLTALEEKDGDLPKVEIDEVLSLVGDIGSKVSAHDYVPGRVVFLVKFLFDEGSDVLISAQKEFNYDMCF